MTMNKRSKLSGASGLASAGLLALALQSAACSGEPFTVVPIEQTYQGLTYGELEAQWWKWGYESPKSSNPLTDSTGANCQSGQKGPVFLLAGYLSSSENGLSAVTRTCAIPAEQALFFPLLNGIMASPASMPKPEAELRQSLKQSLAAVRNLAAEVDGLAIPNLESLRAPSAVFSLTLPADNIFDLAAGTSFSPAVSDGYHVLLKPLGAGPHDVHFHGEVEIPNKPNFVVDVTYHLSVQ